MMFLQYGTTKNIIWMDAYVFLVNFNMSIVYSGSKNDNDSPNGIPVAYWQPTVAAGEAATLMERWLRIACMEDMDAWLHSRPFSRWLRR